MQYVSPTTVSSAGNITTASHRPTRLFNPCQARSRTLAILPLRQDHRRSRSCHLRTSGNLNTAYAVVGRGHPRSCQDDAGLRPQEQACFVSFRGGVPERADGRLRRRGRDGSSGARGRPKQVRSSHSVTEVDPDVLRSRFGDGFLEATERSKARTRHGTFDTSVIEVNKADLPRFIGALHEACEEEE